MPLRAPTLGLFYMVIYYYIMLKRHSQKKIFKNKFSTTKKHACTNEEEMNV